MKFVRKSYIYILFYIFWETLITNGRLLGSPIFRYLSFIVTFSIFFVCLTKTKRIVLKNEGKVWIPFFLWTILGALIFLEPGIMFIWGTAFIVILIAVANNMKVIFPFKLIFYFGLIQIIGQVLQLTAPSVYNQITNILFISSFKEFGTGLQGFTPNPGTISAILVFSFGTYLYFVAPNKNNMVNLTVSAIFILFIFLTGKRSASFLAMVLPLFTFFISATDKSKLVKFGVPILIIVGLTFYFFVQNIDMFSDTIGFKKVSRGIEMFIDPEEEVDFHGREFLWEKAIQGYNENPLFGIGVSQFQNWSGLNTNAHNMYLQVLCEQGMVGLFFFIVPLLYCLINTIKILRKSSDRTPYIQCLKFSLFVQLFFIIYGVSGNPTRNPYGYMMYFIAIGLLQSFQSQTVTHKFKRIVR